MHRNTGRRKRGYLSFIVFLVACEKNDRRQGYHGNQDTGEIKMAVECVKTLACSAMMSEVHQGVRVTEARKVKLNPVETL